MSRWELEEEITNIKKSKAKQKNSVDPLTNYVVAEDCLVFLEKYQGTPIDLIYLDPPYFLDRLFKLEASSDDVSFKGNWKLQEIEEFCHKIAGDSGSTALVKYLSWLYPRLIAMHSKLSESGSLFLHIGTREAPYVSILLDRIFGFNQWRSTVTWQRSHPHNNLKRKLGNVSDFIFYYSKSNKFKFNVLHTPHDEIYLSNSFSNEDERGPYALAPVIQEKSRQGHFYEYKKITPQYGWRIRKETLTALDLDGRVHWGTNRAYKKVYLHEAMGAALQNIWSDIHNITRTEVDNRKYPTQKPIKLLDRIIQIASDPGDLIYDPFCGSGTTIASAIKNNRRFLGTDISDDAIRITQERIELENNSINQKLF